MSSTIDTHRALTSLLPVHQGISVQGLDFEVWVLRFSLGALILLPMHQVKRSKRTHSSERTHSSPRTHFSTRTRSTMRNSAFPEEEESTEPRHRASPAHFVSDISGKTFFRRKKTFYRRKEKRFSGGRVFRFSSSSSSSSFLLLLILRILLSALLLVTLPSPRKRNGDLLTRILEVSTLVYLLNKNRYIKYL